MGFGIEEAVQTANQTMLRSAGRTLSDVEIAILRGAWERLEYDQIAAQNQYATSYVSNDIAPKLWKLLTEALGEKVRKSNFKAALKRAWETPDQDINQEAIGYSSQFLQPMTDQPNTHFVPDGNYILRPPIEANCYAALLKPGALLRVKAPRQTGKTSLVNYLLYQLSIQDYRTVHLSLELTDRRKHLVDLSQFLRWFCLNVSRELGMARNLDEYWDEEGLGAKVSCTTYFEQYLLSYSANPLVLCLDDVDLLFPHPEVYEDFFGLLRSWYEKARSRPIWKRLRLVIVHATDVYIRLNIHQSPFNVGVPINLSDFTLEQAQSLAKAYQLHGTVDQVEPLMNWVGGHPYLLQLAFTDLANRTEENLEVLLSELPTDSGIYGAHLREHLLTLEQEPDLALAFQQVIMADEGITLKSMAAYQLQSMGLISLTGDIARSRCQLYRHYFAERLESSSR